MRNSKHIYIWASFPAALIGIWNIGVQLLTAMPSTTSLWQLNLLSRFGIRFVEYDLPGAIAIGSMFFLPLLLTSLLVSRLWAGVFARARERPLDLGWIQAAWFFALLLPATMPLHYAALSLSFGVVFGCHVFGGTGRYIVHPALLGIVFAAIAYPHLMSDFQWLPGASVPSSWAIAVSGAEGNAQQELSWLPLFFGKEIGAFGATSDFACLLGALFLVIRGAASARLVVAGLAGLVVAGMFIGDLPWYWHLALGNAVFALSFIATDPTTRPRTNGGCWAFGALIGVLIIVLRIGDPGHPEATWFAILIASLLVPFLDHVSQWLAKTRLTEARNDGT